MLVAGAPNYSVIFMSKPLCGSISDKNLTNKCKYFDKIELFFQIMNDKGFQYYQWL